MRYLVEYVHGDISDVKHEAVIIEAALSKEPTYEEENRIFKPIILREMGHSDIKIMNYKQLD
ncbi:hypothetical protein [Cytobacillus solani]|uniref:Uncharacterized protein n=1 Tax=Cytobacillus solani TaxID=1637975 RepID=A0A0Q3T2K0_9BACI|nr:hypothetical protein [Cytobacillus solani]KQL17693.1 hypothetical protein AN957_03080 [Cytobacillus solani]